VTQMRCRWGGRSGTCCHVTGHVATGTTRSRIGGSAPRWGSGSRRRPVRKSCTWKSARDHRRYCVWYARCDRHTDILHSQFIHIRFMIYIYNLFIYLFIRISPLASETTGSASTHFGAKRISQAPFHFFHS